MGLTGTTRGLPEVATEYGAFTMSTFNLLLVHLFVVPFIRLVSLRKKLKKEFDVYTD